MFVTLLLGVVSIFHLGQSGRLWANSFYSPVGFRTSSPQSGKPGRRGLETSRTGSSAIEGILRNVNTPSLKAVAKALGIAAPQMGARGFESSEAGMQVVGDLDGGGVPEAVVEWEPPEQAGAEQSARVPGLYMLSWDGSAWRASHLINVVSPFGLQVLPGSQGGSRLFAVVVFEGVTAVPYPVIFGFQDHAARRLWDGRSDSSLYTGSDYGTIRFKEEFGGGVPEMIASGRADPGLLVFPKGPGRNGRGFEETRIYRWINDTYVPVQTEYTPNEDYTLYRFIAALHLHDFRRAYALIDPQQFLKTSKPSLKLFRERVEKQWPEFLDDRIFRVPSGPGGLHGHIFTLRLESGMTYLYRPIFSAGPRYLLTGLERRAVSD